jgi:NifU-like protein involved in Fe-S cluster formation
MDHINNPRNLGSLEEADLEAESEPGPDGDLVWLYLKVDKKGVIKEINFKTFGCAMCIAASSYLTELVKGMTLKKARKVTLKDLAPLVEGLPKYKLYCHDLALNLLHSMIDAELKR